MKKFKPLKPENRVVREKEKYTQEQKDTGKNAALAYAQERLEKSLYDKIYKSYQIIKWTQLGMIIGFVVFVILAYIFMPDVMIDGTKSLKGYMVALLILIFLCIIMPIWITITSFVFGKTWTKYIKWFRTPGATIPQLYDILKLEYTEEAAKAAKYAKKGKKSIEKP